MMPSPKHSDLLFVTNSKPNFKHERNMDNSNISGSLWLICDHVFLLSNIN
jgi:hypothetical protein